MQRDGWLPITGNNCSAHEADGIDTPNNLYDQIVSESPIAWKSYSGYLEFEPIGSGAGQLMLPYVVTLDPTAVPTIGGGGGSTV